MKVFYDMRQSVPGNISCSPSAGKPLQVLESWKNLGIPFHVESFSPLTSDDIALAHDREYVDGVLSCTLMNGYGNRSPELASALPWVSGSMVAAALHSFISNEVSFSPTSGAHHACYANGGDYCTFNFLAIAAIKVHQAGASRVGILDLDYHYGNGTDDIIEKLNLSYIRHYSSGRNPENRPAYAELWLKQLSGIVEKFNDCDLIIYNAGVDSHINDPLGGNLTSEQMARRDRMVFEVARGIGVPICTSLAGGYQVAFDGTIDPVLRLHDTTFASAWEVFESIGVKSCNERWTLW